MRVVLAHKSVDFVRTKGSTPKIGATPCQSVMCISRKNDKLRPNWPKTEGIVPFFASTPLLYRPLICTVLLLVSALFFVPIRSVFCEFGLNVGRNLSFFREMHITL